jgi:hypothetical protein
MSLHLEYIQRRFHREGMRRRSNSPANHSRKEVAHRLPLLFNLPLRPLQRNNKRRCMLKIRDFGALSNIASGKTVEEWKFRSAWLRRVCAPVSIQSR